VPPRVHLLDLTGPAHIFYEGKQHGIDLDLNYLSITQDSEINSSAGLQFSNLIHFSKIETKKDDIIIVPGMEFACLQDVDFLRKSAGFFNWIVESHQKKCKIVSICTGAFLIAESGILQGRRCTTHWKYFAHFKSRFPEIELIRNRLFVEDDQIFSSAGVASGIDLALYLIEEAFGSKLAADIARETVIYLRRTASDPQLSIFLQYRNHLDHKIHAVQDFIIQHLDQTISLDRIAEELFMSRRSLSRNFKAVTGITVGNYLDKLRIEKAIQLLTQGYKVSYVSNQCGLKSPNQLRNLLKKYRDVLPSHLNKRSNLA